jgi:hypothetical protein
LNLAVSFSTLFIHSIPQIYVISFNIKIILSDIIKFYKKTPCNIVAGRWS